MKLIVVGIVAILLQFGATIAIELSDDGGYRLVVAVDQDTVEPANVEQYLDNLKRSLQSMSTSLWQTTERFHLKSVQILIPGSWPMAADVDEADISISYNEAAIRLSSHIKYPSVDNPNPCGLAGQSISLPWSFFAVSNAGDYGLTWKALLTLWARFRYGVWEEHGYPTSRKYPYFSKPSVDAAEWSATGCSNEPLFGRYVDESGSTCDMSTSPSAECRFHPDPQNQATSSLMHFHWLDTVTKFCDAATHNQYAPNRQNLLCGQKSVMEVIQSSADFKSVTVDPTDPIETIKFSVVKPNTKPFLYFLVDKGFPQVDTSILTAVAHGFIKFFEPRALPNVRAGMGTFPFTLIDGLAMSADIGFVSLEDNLDAFIEKFGHFQLDGDETRDFASPIVQVARVIQAKGPPVGGGVIFMLKIGGTGLLESMPYEDEVAAMLRQAHIKVITLELGRRHFENFADKFDGLSFSITTVEQVDQILEQILAILQVDLEKSLPAPTQTLDLLYKGNVIRSTPVNVEVTASAPSIEIYLIVPSSNTGTIIVRVNGASTSFTKSTDWSVSGLASSRQIVKLLTLTTDKDETWTIEYVCNGPGCDERPGHLLVYGITQLTEPALSAKNDAVHIAISTSAIDGIIDFKQTADTLSPFAIFAKITQGGLPVRDLQATALTLNTETNQVHSMKLLDDGSGAPDVDRLDGIYSRNFIPSLDGVYKISVHVQNPNSDATSGSQSGSSSARLMPIDQVDLGPEESIGMEGQFQETAQITELVTVVNIASLPTDFLDRPFKITDVLGTEGPDKEIIVSFTTPQIPGSIPATILYDVYASKSVDSLPEPGSLILSDQPGDIEPGNPELRSIIISQEMYANSMYLAIQSKNEDVKSKLSNILKLAEGFEDVSSTTEPSTTPETETEPTTTPPNETDPTATPGTETEPPTTTPASPGPEPEPTTPLTGPATTPGIGPSPTAPTTTGPPEPEDDKKPFFKTAAGIVVVILIVLIVAGAVGAGIHYFLRRRQSFQKLDDLS